MTTSCVRGPAGPGPLHWLAVAFLLIAVGPSVVGSPAAAEAIVVPLDQAESSKSPNARPPS